MSMEILLVQIAIAVLISYIFFKFGIREIRKNYRLEAQIIGYQSDENLIRFAQKNISEALLLIIEMIADNNKDEQLRAVMDVSKNSFRDNFQEYAQLADKLLADKERLNTNDLELVHQFKSCLRRISNQMLTCHMNGSTLRNLEARISQNAAAIAYLEAFISRLRQEQV